MGFWKRAKAATACYMIISLSMVIIGYFFDYNTIGNILESPWINQFLILLSWVLAPYLYDLTEGADE